VKKPRSALFTGLIVYVSYSNLMKDGRGEE
jgi:hypothetical protein